MRFLVKTGAKNKMNKFWGFFIGDLIHMLTLMAMKKKVQIKLLRQKYVTLMSKHLLFTNNVS